MLTVQVIIDLLNGLLGFCLHRCGDPHVFTTDMNRVVEVTRTDEAARIGVHHVPVRSDVEATKNLTCGMGSHSEPIQFLHVQL